MSSIDQLFGKDISKNSNVTNLFQTSNSIEKKIVKIKQDNNDDDLEGKYFQKLADEEEKEDNETAKKEKTLLAAQPAKQIDLKQDEVDKAQRTIFVGNIPTEVITSRDIYKHFKRMFTPKSTGDDEDNVKDADKENADKAKNNDNKKEKLTIQSIRFRSISFDEALPRKVAFAKQSFHKDRHSINAYIVYSSKDGLVEIINKYNGHVFEKRHLRVDSVTHPAPHDKQRSIFVGNLDFEEDEESLWNHFSESGDIEYVRIVRDSKTNMGKGFAYVQFKQLESINKALLLNEKPMKSINSNKNRKLRISRCKNIKPKYNNESGTNSFNTLNEQQKTKFGRAKKVLNKSDRATLGKELTIEGVRAEKNVKSKAGSMLKKRKQRSKEGRVTKRSIAFKKKQSEKKK